MLAHAMRDHVAISLISHGTFLLMALDLFQLDQGLDEVHGRRSALRNNPRSVGVPHASLLNESIKLRTSSRD